MNLENPDSGLIADVKQCFELEERLCDTTQESSVARLEGGVSEELQRREDNLLAEMNALRARILETPAYTVRGALARLEHAYCLDELADVRSGKDKSPDDVPGDIAVVLLRDLDRLVAS